MQQLKQEIISLLEQKATGIPTSDILKHVSRDYLKYKSLNKHGEARKVHRRILYHLNMLVSENILKIERLGENGQKFYAINLTAGEQITAISPSKYKKKLQESVSFMPPIPIEGYEQEGIVVKYGTLTERLNSVVVMCDKNQEELMPLVKKLLFIVDDCVCLENFALEVNKKGISVLIKDLDRECSLYGRKISLSINLSDVEKGKLIELMKETINLKNTNFIFGVEKKSLIEKSDFISELLETYAKQNKNIFFKNRDKFDLPYFVGNAGVYSFDEEEWKAMEDKPTYIACSQSTVLIDVKKFYDKYGFNFARFKELLMNISKSFLSTNPVQRKKLRDYFKEVVPNYHRDFLELSRNYIRLWNFGLLEPELEKEKVLEIINKSKEKIDEFATVQDRIFNSCGMPIRFKLALNQASKKSNQSLSSAKYKQMEVENLNSVLNELEDRIKETNKVSQYFDGGIHVNLHRVGKANNSKELFNEISVLLNKYDLAFFSYDLGGLEYE